MKLDIGVRLPHDAETVSLVREVATGALTAFGVTRECADDIRLALSEACTNVIKHAGRRDEYEIRFLLEGHRCVIEVKNTGKGFDAAGLVDVSPDVTSAHGRGVAIMRAIMDRVEFDSKPENGTLVRLVKTLTVDPDGMLARRRIRSEGKPAPRNRARSSGAARLIHP